MKPPRVHTYLFGNIVVFAATILFTLYSGYQALTAQGPGLLAIIMMFAVAYCANCSSRLSAYAAWKQEWAAMSGQPVKSPFSLSKSWLRWPVGITAWAIGASWALSAGADPAMQFAARVFWLAAMLGIAVLLFRVARDVNRRNRRAVATKITVTVCPNVPLSSVMANGNQNISNHLPAYCQRLIRNL